MIPIILLSLLVLLALTIFIWAPGETKLGGLIFVIPIIGVCGYMDTSIKSYKLYPVSYTIEQTSVKIFSITDYGVFESDKMIDFEKWTQSDKQGYIIKCYDYFGEEDSKEFTVTPYDKGINYDNENNK